MSKYRSDLPQLDGDLFLTDSGLETFLYFKQGIDRDRRSRRLRDVTNVSQADMRGRAHVTRLIRAVITLSEDLNQFGALEATLETDRVYTPLHQPVLEKGVPMWWACASG